MKNYLVSFLLLMGLLNLTGCIPHMENVGDDSTTVSALQQAQLTSTLNNTQSGRGIVSFINQLSAQGHPITISYANATTIQQANGHSGGGYRANGNGYEILILDQLSTQDAAQVLAHEIMHISDEIEIDQATASRPYINQTADQIVKVVLQQNGNINQFPAYEINYVLDTLFCTEVRAYSMNQALVSQGIASNLLNHQDSELGSFIDTNYIQRFGTSFGGNANSMLNWCRGFSSMTSIQQQLMW
jgi:hypothetical protein